MITVAESRPQQVEAMRFTGDNIDEIRNFVEFTGHKFQKDVHPFTPDSDRREIFFIDQRPGVILTVFRGEWLVYNLSDAIWRVYSDKDFQRQFSQE